MIMNNILEIEIEYETELEDNFSSDYIYIDKFYQYNDNNKKNVDIIDPQSYSVITNCFVDSTSALDSVCALGKEIMDKFNINRFDEINGFTLRKFSENSNILIDWIKVNFFPYEHITSEFQLEFIKDSVMCYMIYDINKWILKSLSNIEDIKEILKKDTIIVKNNENEYNQQIEELYEKCEIILNNLEDALDRIDFDTLVFNNEHMPTITNLSLAYNNQFIDNYNQMKDYKLVSNAKLDENNVLNYIQAIRRHLIIYISNFIRENYHFIKKFPFYEPTLQQYRLFEAAPSLITIVYNRLLMNLTATKESYIRKICANPSCNNEFETKKNRRRLYCKNKRCQQIRSAKNSRKSYHKKRPKP